MKKVVFILPNLNAGGAERVALNFLRQLDVDSSNITLVVFQETDQLLSLVPKYVDIIDLGTISTSRSYFKLLSIIRKTKPSVVFSTHSRVAALLLFLKPFCPKFKHVARMQNTPSLEKKFSAYGPVKRKIYSLAFQRADVVISQTEAMKKEGIDIFRISPAIVKVLPNPIDTKYIDECIKYKFSPFPPGQISAVASGRLAYAKGFDNLIFSLPEIVENHPNFVLYILGNDNGEEGRLKKLVCDLDLSNNVTFMGFQDNPYYYYAHCDLFILSSRWEGFPNVLIENYYLNTPMVATTCVPIVKDLVLPGVNGFLTPPDDVEKLKDAVLKCLSLKRADIDNEYYANSLLESLL
ncbi:Glycosyltransferase involved in cell wall bisynthesis [Vreelandella subterranea]|uniref:Glycosyltransferase involved in cell wall bisynthesis n=1 Tax=Vreelandella subterranea TaxID=416874 RepID=A0A1H9RS24_9GAMM|nr:glycosyltransferase [Halomonas subterranea]SER75255.1 Glycosyltransferase involved in cell wall bisynthesis [Halomonas subterranea]